MRILDLSTHQLYRLPGSEGLWSPRWSPDGLSIIALGLDARSLKGFSFKTKKWSEIEKGEVEYPTFSRDGKFIFFWRWASEQGVFRLRLSDGKVERVVDLKGLQTTSVVNRWMGLDPTDAPIFLRDRSTTDVYALSLEEK